MKAETPEELRDELAKLRMAALSFLRSVSTANPELLHAMGYGGKTNAEATLLALQAQLKKIDAVILDFEKRHPR